MPPLKVHFLQPGIEEFKEIQIRPETKQVLAPRCSLVANAGGRAFCQELGMGWVHIGQWIFSISAISHWLFWRNCVFCVFTL